MENEEIMQSISAMNNSQLLDLYSNLVRTDHYDPHTTPKEMQKLYDANITQDMLWNLILDRMGPQLEHNIVAPKIVSKKP